jgi:hypothetical protein
LVSSDEVARETSGTREKRVIGCNRESDGARLGLSRRLPAPRRPSVGTDVIPMW